eukprot:2861610-Rhodomonas_salina.2
MMSFGGLQMGFPSTSNDSRYVDAPNSNGMRSTSLSVIDSTLRFVKAAMPSGNSLMRLEHSVIRSRLETNTMLGGMA